MNHEFHRYFSTSSPSKVGKTVQISVFLPANIIYYMIESNILGMTEQDFAKRNHRSSQHAERKGHINEDMGLKRLNKHAHTHIIYIYIYISVCVCMHMIAYV